MNKKDESKYNITPETHALDSDGCERSDGRRQ